MKKRQKKIRPEFNVLAGLLILSGIALLLEGKGFIPTIHNLWPIFLLITGTGLTILFYTNKKDTGLVFLGSFMILLSILFFYLNFTSWAQLERLWPLFITLIGISTLLCYSYNRKKIFMVIGLLGILLSAAFILIFSISVELWPISLIIVGLSIYIISFFDKGKLV